MPYHEGDSNNVRRKTDSGNTLSRKEGRKEGKKRGKQRDKNRKEAPRRGRKDETIKKLEYLIILKIEILEKQAETK